MAIQRGARLSPPPQSRNSALFDPRLLCVSFHQNLIHVNIGQLFVMGLIVIIVGVGSSLNTGVPSITGSSTSCVCLFTVSQRCRDLKDEDEIV